MEQFCNTLNDLLFSTTKPSRPLPILRVSAPPHPMLTLLPQFCALPTSPPQCFEGLKLANFLWPAHGVALRQFYSFPGEYHSLTCLRHNDLCQNLSRVTICAPRSALRPCLMLFQITELSLCFSLRLIGYGRDLICSYKSIITKNQ